MTATLARRLYRTALRLLPAGFRARHDAELRAQFDALIDAGAPRALVLLRAIADVVARAPHLHVAERAARRRMTTTPFIEDRSMVRMLMREARYSLRGFVRAPGFTIAAVLTLGLGLGVATAIFSVVNGVLLRPLPYAAPGRIVNIWGDFGVGAQSLPAVSTADFLDFKRETRSFADLAAASGAGVIGVSGIVTGNGAAPEKVDVSPVTANFFPLLGVKPLIGRQFTAEEEAFRGPQVVMLSYELWRRRYGADSSIVGRTIELDGVPQLVAGVLPESFRLLLPAEAFLVKDSQIWKPLQIDREHLAPRNYTGLTVFARLAPNVSLAEAQREMDALMIRFRTLYAEHAAAKIRMRLVPLRDDIVKGVRPTLALLLAAAGVVLVVVCANVASLLLARGNGRERELAIRVAMGATRGRVVSQLLVESVLLSLFGAVIGVTFAAGALAYLSHVQPANLPRLADVRLDGQVLAFTMALSLVTSAVFGLAPAAYAVKRGIAGSLRAGTRAAGGGSGRLRSTLIVVEMSLSLVLLIAMSLLLRSFFALQNARPGFDAASALTFQVSLPRGSYRGANETNAFMQTLDARLRELAGVTAVGFTSQLPLTGSGPLQPYAYDEATARNWESVTADRRQVTSDFFAATGTRLLAGRAFMKEEGLPGTEQTIIIDETLAKRAFPGGDAVGKRLQINAPGVDAPSEAELYATVVGVVEHMRIHDVGAEVRSLIFTPCCAGRRVATFGVVVRTSNDDPARLMPQVRTLMRELDPQLPVSALRPMSAYVDDSLARARLTLVLMQVMGALALFLAAVGIYGVISFSVGQRTREFGLRMALGDTPGGLRRSVLRQGIRLLVPSIVLGTIGGALAARVMRGVLHGVSPNDPLMFIAGSVFLAVVTLLACDAPARRAARVDPLTALNVDR